MSEVSQIPTTARGIYVLYKVKDDRREVIYIGVAELSSRGGDAGVKVRIRNHMKRKKNWTHFSVLKCTTT